MIRILQGDCRDVLRALPDQSVQCCVTSPPYFNQRDYKVAGQIGLEKTPEEYVWEMVEVFRRVWRVLKDDGVLFLNLGDSYARDASKGQHGPGQNGPKQTAHNAGSGRAGALRLDRSDKHFGAHMSHCNQGDYLGTCCYGDDDKCPAIIDGVPPGLKPKDLIGIPWMVAFALRSEGWFLRADNVWGKPNGMPESTTDRTTRSHEYVFMFSKSSRYFYDHEAVRTAPKAMTQTQLAKPYLGESTKPHAANGVQDASDIKRRIVDKQRGHSRRHDGFNNRWDAMERSEQVAEGGNLRSVWWISPAQSRDGHFAVMPDALAEICIRAGSREGDTILDPFGGAGTTALVADRLQRSAVSIELNPEYVEIQRTRVTADAGMFTEIAAA